MFLLDRCTSTTMIASSESGNSALLYRKLNDSIEISNSLKEIIKSASGTLEIRYQRIYDLFIGNNLGSDNTCFTDVLRLLPGHFMVIRDGVVTISEYSKLFCPSNLTKLGHDPYLHFRAVVRQSVKHRSISDRIGIALSSGLDSTAVTAMAASSLRNEEQRLIGYTYKPNYLPLAFQSQYRYDETILLKSFLQQYPDLLHKEVKIESGSLLEGLEQAIEIYGEPVYGASNQYWVQKMHRLMQEDECGVMFTGQGGNYTISWPPPELAVNDLTFIHALARRLRQFQNHRISIPYITEDFLRNINRDHFIHNTKSLPKRKLQSKLLKNSISYTAYLQKQASLFYGFHVTDPTVDKNILEYCLSLPYDAYHDQQKSRKLVRDGLVELLPKEILNNEIRSIQASDIQMRMQLERKGFIDKLEFLNKNKLVTFVLEIEGLARDLKSMDFTKMRRKELNHLLRIFLIGIFLEKFGG